MYDTTLSDRKEKALADYIVQMVSSLIGCLYLPPETVNCICLLWWGR